VCTLSVGGRTATLHVERGSGLPVSNLFVLGVLLGVDLLIIGIGCISVGFGLKSRA
jgi:hypothetical protein